MPAGSAPKGDLVQQDVKHTQEVPSYQEHDEVELTTMMSSYKAKTMLS